MDEEKKQEVTSEEAKLTENKSVEINEEPKKEEVKEQDVKKEDVRAEEVKAEEVKEEAKKDEKPNEPKIENISSSKKNSSSKTPIIIGIVAILLIVCAAGLFYYFKNSSSASKVFKGILSSYKEQVSENMNLSGAKSMNSKVALDVDLKLEDGLIEKEIVDLINDIELTMNMGMDIDKSNISYNITAKKEDSELVNVDAYIVEDVMYAKLNGLLNKTLKIESEDLKMPEIDYVALYDSERIVINKAVDAIVASLDEKYFTQDVIDGEKKNTLVLNDSNTKAIIKSVITSLKDDKEFIEELSKICEVDGSDISTSMNDILSSIDSEVIFGETESIEVSIFTGKMSNKISKVVIAVIDDTQTIGSAILNVVSEEEISYEISADEQKISGNMIVKYLSDTNVEMSFTVKYAEYIDAKINMKSEYAINTDKNIELPDFDDAVSIEDITSKDTQELLTNLQKNEALVDIVNVISSLPSGDDYDFGDDDFDDEGDVSDETDDEDDEGDQDKDDGKDEEIADNSLEYEGFKVEFEIPKGYQIDSENSSNRSKYFESEDDDTNIDAYVRIGYYTADEYFENVEEHEYGYKVNDDDDFYKNVEMSDIQEKKFGKNTVKYVTLTYDAGETLKYDEIYAIYELNDKYSYMVEISARNTEVPSKVFESFATFTVSK